MLSPQALLKLIVSRTLPQGNADGPQNEVFQRAGRYGEGAVLSYIRKQHLLADEGQYFVANNAQTAITAQATNAYDATKPTILIANTDSSSNPLGKRIYIDYIALLAGGTAYSNATSNTGIFWQLGIDSGNRYSSGGTALTIANPNMDIAAASSVAKAYAGGITTTAASGQFRNVSAMRLMRLPVSATVLSLANSDRFFFTFGGVEANAGDIQLQASATVEVTTVARAMSGPPVIIGPNQSFLFNINAISNGTPVAGNLHVEIGWWER